MGDHNRLLSDGTYSYEYDGEGNRIKRTNLATGEVTEYVWDHRNRLVAVIDRLSEDGPIIQSVEYVYDSQNRWIGKAVDADGDGPEEAVETHFVYQGNQIILQVDDEGEVTNRYLWGPAVDQILADEQVEGDGSSEVLWPLTDHLNTVRDLAVYEPDADVTTVLNHIVYDAFGRVTGQNDPSVGTLFGFTARAFDSDTGLQNNLNRWYDAETGTWISVDPMGFAAADANLYRYVGNEVTTGTDPTGQAWYNPFSWFPNWDKKVDEELAAVRQLNEMFGTTHIRLDAFTPEGRARIETALGQKLDWEGGAIRASQGALETRDNVLIGSKVALYGSAAAAATATGVGVYQAAGGSTFAMGTTDGHWFYGVTQGGTTTWAHWLPGHGVTQIGANLYGAHAGYWTTIEGVPIFFPQAALGTAGGQIASRPVAGRTGQA